MPANNKFELALLFVKKYFSHYFIIKLRASLQCSMFFCLSLTKHFIILEPYYLSCSYTYEVLEYTEYICPQAWNM